MRSPTPGSSCGAPRNSGNVTLLSLLVLTTLAAMATAQFMVLHRNSQSSAYFLSHSKLREYADTGIDLAIHDLKYDQTGNDGKIGTTAWTTANDLGRDGRAGTADQGEGDGIPTPGEPNVTPSAIGPTLEGGGVIVHVADTAYADVQRIVATAVDASGGLATVETYARRTVTTIPRVGALMVDPNIALDFNGNSFMIDGNDQNPDGSAGTDPALSGIATTVGSPAGTNEAAILAQIPAKNYDQVLGEGGEPSLGEVAGVDIDALFEQFKALETNSLASGTYSDPDLGDADAGDFRVTYVSGDIQFSGRGEGAGILVVEGSLTLTGQFSFQGVVLVKGDVRLTGGGTGCHVWGTLMVGESITAIEEGDDSEIKLSGNAEVRYSSSVLDQVESSIGTSYSVVYYNDN